MRSWIKLRTLEDARLDSLSDPTFADYIKLYKLAGRLDHEGLFFDNGRLLTDSEIAYIIRVNTSRLKKTFKELKDAKLLHVNGKGPMLTDWPATQVDMNKVREQTRERVARYRKGETQGNALQDDVTQDEREVTPLDQIRPDKTRPDQRRPDKKRPTNPNPSSQTKQSGRKAGKESEKDSSADQSPIRPLTKRQIEIIAHTEPILRSSGLRNPKLNTTLVYVATRHKIKTKEDAAHYVLAALASSYSDPTAGNKNSVAAHRIENNSVPAEYLTSPHIWVDLPPVILKAAGAESLNDYVSAHAHQTSDPLQSKINKLRERTNDITD